MSDTSQLPLYPTLREWAESGEAYHYKCRNLKHLVIELLDRYVALQASVQSFDPRKMCSRCAGSDPGCRICKDLLASQQAEGRVTPEMCERFRAKWDEFGTESDEAVRAALEAALNG